MIVDSVGRDAENRFVGGETVDIREAKEQTVCSLFETLPF